MEAQYTRDQRRRRLALIGGLALAVVAAMAVYIVLTRPGGPETPPPAQRTIIVAAVDIPARTQISDEMLITQQVPQDPVFASADTDIEAVVGQVAFVDIAQGQVIYPNMHGTGSAAGLAIIPPGETIAPDAPIWRAVSISATSERAVGGMLSTGDRIDLFVTLEPQIYDPNGPATGFTDPDHQPSSGLFYSAMTTKLVWENLEILSVDLDNSLYVLRVDAGQAEQIAHVQSRGSQFTIGLRAATDDRQIDREELGQTDSQMIDEYGFPIPIQIMVPSGPFGGPSPAPPPVEEPTPEEP